MIYLILELYCELELECTVNVSFIFDLLCRTISCRGTAHALESVNQLELRNRSVIKCASQSESWSELLCFVSTNGSLLRSWKRGLDQLITEQLQWQNLSACAEELYKAPTLHNRLPSLSCESVSVDIWVPHVLEDHSVVAGGDDQVWYQKQDGGKERRTQYLNAVDFDSKLLHHDVICCELWRTCVVHLSGSLAS